jgi:hypothetical protein
VRTTLTLTLVLLVSAGSLRAQDAGKTTGKASGLDTIEGCLQNSNGDYTIIDSNNTIHILTGAANKLGHQVGHEVEVTGKPGIRTVDTTSLGGASSAVEQPVFQVKSVKQIAARCKSTGN